MTSFIKYKKKKISRIFEILGKEHTETDFINMFKSSYPDDWQRIQEVWLCEEANTPPGKKHPMQHPEIYMKEMYRNYKLR